MQLQPILVLITIYVLCLPPTKVYVNYIISEYIIVSSLKLHACMYGIAQI